MRYFSAILPLMLLLATPSFSAERPAQITRVADYLAVFDLEIMGDVDPRISRPLSDSIRREIVKSGEYRVIDRGNMEKILKEQAFQMTGCVAKECAVEAGQLLGVGKIIIGSLGLVGKTYYLSLSQVNVETGETEQMAEERCRCEVDELIDSAKLAARKLMREAVPEGPGTQIEQKAGEEAVPNIIRISGNIEVPDAEVSFKISGRLQERLVSEGETVRSGQVVARLDSTELVQGVALRRGEVQAAQAALAELEAGSRPEEIAQAEASVRTAQARLEELLVGSRSQEIATAEAKVQRAKEEAERLKLEEERYRRLHLQALVSAQQYDVARTNYEVAKAKQKVAEENLKLIQEGPGRGRSSRLVPPSGTPKNGFSLWKKVPGRRRSNTPALAFNRPKRPWPWQRPAWAVPPWHLPLLGLSFRKMSNQANLSLLERR